MREKLKTFWLNIGFLDRDMDLSERIQILQALKSQNIEVRANFNYIKIPRIFCKIDKLWLLPLRFKGILGVISLFAEQQFTLLKNHDTDFIVLTPFNLHQTLPIWFILKKILRRSKPKFILDIRTLPVDLVNGKKASIRQKRFNTSVRIASHHFDGLTLISEKMKDNLKTVKLLSHKKTCVWSSGVDTNLFNPDTSGNISSKSYMFDRFVIMYHGFFSPNRGLQQTVQAINIVKNTYPQILFFLLGKGPAEGELRKMVRNLDLDNHVHIQPPVALEEVPKYIKLAKVGILPFPDLDWWNTSSPIKLNEYLAMSKPVIVTDIAAHRDALGDTKCAFYILDHHPDTIANGIINIINKEKELEGLASIARQHVLQKFTWEIQARKIKEYLIDISELS